MSEIRTRIFERKEFFEKYMKHDKVLEKELGGIPVRAEITSEKVIQEYLPVVEFEFYIDVWDYHPRFAKRIIKGGGIQETEIIELQTEEAEKLFEQLCIERDIIINRSGHYYIETQQQKQILDQILKIEGLR